MDVPSQELLKQDISHKNISDEKIMTENILRKNTEKDIHEKGRCVLHVHIKSIVKFIVKIYFLFS